MNALVLLGHGSRDPGWVAPLVRVREVVTHARPALAVELAFLEFMSPTLEEAVAALAGCGATRIVVAPVFLAQGGHLRRDLPARLDSLRQRYPACTLRLATVAGEAPGVIAAIAAHVGAQADLPG
ncbi:MAG: CbiX/SirB N-terminal domain-containing protein [Azoarcus sp.]|nr:CbiX/SirB N-terminal domain-containing protein [Azoarcus sp.]